MEVAVDVALAVDDAISLYHRGTSNSRYIDKWSSEYNCWSFVADLLGWNEGLHWLSPWTMWELLRKHSRPVCTTPRRGDILCFWYRPVHNEDTLRHTALYMGDGMILHKPGNWDLNFSHYPSDLWEGEYGDIIQYRRPILNNKLSGTNHALHPQEVTPLRYC